MHLRLLEENGIHKMMRLNVTLAKLRSILPAELTSSCKPVPAMTPSSWASLAFIRFVLSAIVATAHLSWFVPSLSPPLNLLGALNGKAAVIGFFLISGFSVGHSYLTRRNGYFERRFLRIYPLYSMAVVFTTFLYLYLGGFLIYPGANFTAPGIKTHIANLFFLQNFVAITIVYDSPLWSLSIEVLLYLLLPLFFRLHIFYLGFLTVISMVVFATPFLADYLPGKGHLGGYLALQYAWPFILGLMLVSRLNKRFTVALALCGAFLVYLNPLTQGGGAVFIYSAVFSVLLLGNYAILPSRVVSIFNCLGDFSYPLYLFHLPLYMFCYSLLGVRESVAFVVCVIVLVIAIDWIFDKWLKKIFWRPALQRCLRFRLSN